MRLKILKLVNYGWTNVSYLASLKNKKVFVKFYLFNFRTFLLFSVYMLFCLLNFKISPIPIFPKDRIKNEKKMSKKLERLGFKVPKIIASDSFLVREWIEGESLYEAIKNSSPKRIREIAFKKGMQLASLHEKGIALIDSKTSNSLLSNNQIFYTDLEFSVSNAKEFQKYLDLLTLNMSIPKEKYFEFWESFVLGYKKVRKFPKLRKDLLGFCKLAYSLFRFIGFL